MGTPHRWADVHTLRLPGMSVDPATWTASFDYELLGSESALPFTEFVTFAPPSRPPDAAALDAFDRVLHLLYVAIGTSYYKVAAPRRIDLDAARIAEKALPWATSLFRQGLAEFAYRNDLPHVLDLDLTPGPETLADDAPAHGNSAGRPLVPVGGGKDSIVSVEALRGAGFEPVLFAVNPNPIITSVMAVAGLPALRATRTLDRRLFELNRDGAYNGHIPVTAINSLIAVATSVLHGLGPVVMSNESSASVGNLEWLGRQVNHQWSKGIDAERQLREALAAQAGLPDAYFSLLRPLSELHIAKLFARFDAYDDVVTSCNAAFKLTDRSARWCGNCPKCQFVFLALAPFVPRARLVHIFGKDMFEDEKQLPGYRDLVGISAHKPFECVGETEESLVALRLAAERDDWADTAVVRRLRAELPEAAWPSDAEVARMFRTDAPHYATPEYARAVTELEGSGRAPG